MHVNVRSRLASLIAAPDPHTLHLAGQPLVVLGSDAEKLATEWREAVARRFVERRPNATEHTWQYFERVLRAWAAQQNAAGKQTLEELFTLVDGL